MNSGWDAGFFRNVLIRKIRQDYLENLTGFAWLVIQPVLLLAIYAFVFTTIFKARIPDLEEVSFVAYLAVAFWPWTAFSDSILRASNSITENAALIGKVSIASEQLPLAAVSATFIMNLAGYLAVLVVLQLTGTDIHWGYLLATLSVLLILWLLACGIALIASATQVFIRDVAQILPPLMTFWFFATPILYSTSLLPPRLQALFYWNPMTWFVNQFREQLLFGNPTWNGLDLLPLVLVPLFFIAALKYFRRFSGHFEDFL